MFNGKERVKARNEKDKESDRKGNYSRSGGCITATFDRAEKLVYFLFHSEKRGNYNSSRKKQKLIRLLGWGRWAGSARMKWVFF